MIGGWFKDKRGLYWHKVRREEHSIASYGAQWIMIGGECLYSVSTPASDVRLSGTKEPDSGVCPKCKAGGWYA